MIIKLIVATMSFVSENLAKQAAKWWAQYLPGVRDADSSEIHDLEDDNPAKAIIEKKHTMQKSNVVPKELINKFIEILQQKILLLEIKSGYVTLGHQSSYHPPKEVSQSIKETGIYAMFPFKTEMIIHQDGYILVNDELVYLEENLRLLVPNDELLTESVKVKISLPQIRILKIDLTVLEGDLYQYNNGEAMVLEKYEYFNTWKGNKPYESFYVEFKFSNFIGGEKALRYLSDADLLNILQNKEKFTVSIKNNTFLYYFTDDITKKEASYGNGWGKLQYEDVGKGYFRITTGFVNAFKVPVGDSYVVRSIGWRSELIKVTDHHLLVPSDDKFQIFDLTDDLEFVYEI